MQLVAALPVRSRDDGDAQAVLGELDECKRCVRLEGDDGRETRCGAGLFELLANTGADGQCDQCPVAQRGQRDSRAARQFVGGYDDRIDGFVSDDEHMQTLGRFGGADRDDRRVERAAAAHVPLYWASIWVTR